MKPTTGTGDYRSYVGPPEKYDLVAAIQFTIMFTLGLREHNLLLDIGCGSLRAGRLFIPYLLPGHYHGIEPNKWLIDEGIKNEIGDHQIQIKQPEFNYNSDFELTCFGHRFDYLLAQSIFSHAPASSIKKCLNEAREVMTYDAIFVISFGVGNTSYEGETWSYPQCVTYTGEDMLQMIEDAGLMCSFVPQMSFATYTWVLITRPKFNGRLRASLAEAVSKITYWKR